MGLFKPTWMSKDKEKALRAVERLTDQSQIAKAAKNAPLEDVQIAAVAKLTDQSILADVVKSYNTGSMSPIFRAKIHSNYYEFLRDSAKRRRVSLEESSNPTAEDNIYTYKQNTKYQDVRGMIDRLDSASYEIRKAAAIDLINIANTEPGKIIQVWNWIKKKVEEPYRTRRLNEYDREEAGIYDDVGIGMKFPDKPKDIE